MLFCCCSRSFYFSFFLFLQENFEGMVMDWEGGGGGRRREADARNGIRTSNLNLDTVATAHTSFENHKHSFYATSAMHSSHVYHMIQTALA